MATAAELLAAGTEEHIVVGTDRRIKIPAALKRLAVQFDHDIETVTFDCPRYWDDHDMSKMAVYVNYMRSDGYKDRYPAGNVRVDGDIMHFDWTISRNVTEVVGVISFLICVMKTDAQGNEERHWNSELSQEAYVSEGMECEESPVDMYPDLVTQLLLRMDSVEQINVQADEMQALYDATVEAANTAEQVKNEALDASDYIKNSYAPAIKGNISGEIVRVDDVSPIEHGVKCWVHGKNLFDATRIPVGAGVTNNYVSAVGEGFVEITSVDPYDGNGHISSTVKLRDLCPQMQPGKTYILSAKSDAFNKCMYLNQLDYFWQFNTAVTITEEMLNCGTGFYGYAPYRGQEHGTCRIYDIQIEEGLVATAYEPYVDPTTVTVTGCGKNVLELSGNITHNGVTKTVDSSGLITVKGTSTTSININVGNGFLKGGYKYRPTIQKIKSDVAPSFWNFQTQANINKDKDGYISSEVDTEFSAFIYTSSAGTVYDSAFKVMVELVTDDMTEDYESYKGTEVVVTSSDGTCTVTSKSPTMTLFTDTPGVTVEAEYNRDTTKMFESYVLTPEAKSEIAGIVESDMAEVLAALNEYTEALIGGDS